MITDDQCFRAAHWAGEFDPKLRDVFGVPVARITYQNHNYEKNASGFYIGNTGGRNYLADDLNAAAPPGATVQTLSEAAATGILSPVPTSAHIMGTLRMGDDPATSVTDPGGKFHGLENLYAADGSLFVTSAGMNPSLTITALGYRVGCSIIDPDNPLEVAKAIDRKLF